MTDHTRTEKIGGDSTIFIFGSHAKSWRETVMTGTIPGWALWGCQSFLTRNHIPKPTLVPADIRFVRLMDLNLF